MTISATTIRRCFGNDLPDSEILRFKITHKIIIYCHYRLSTIQGDLLKPTARDLRKINRQNLLQLIYFHAPVSRLELSELSHLSPATVTNVVTGLLNEGIVTEFGLQESQGGRPRTSLALNADYGYFLGVDLGETH